MKLIYIANARLPTEKAHGIQIMNMCEAFTRAGVDVKLVTPFRVQSKRMSAVKNIWEFYGIECRFRIIRIPSLDFIWLDRFLPEKISLLLFHSQSILFALESLIYSLGKKEVHYYTRDFWVAMMLCPFRKIILELHNFSARFYRIFAGKKVFSRVDKIVVTKNAIRKRLVALGIPEHKILLAPNGVDVTKFANLALAKEEARKKLGLPVERKLIIYTGHLFRWKGVYTLAMAGKDVDYKTEIIMIGGTENDQHAMREFLNEYGIKSIKIIGYVPPIQIPLYLTCADVVVLPNTAQDEESKRYTTPLKLFEYMASKRPIVASDLPSVREILQNEKNAVLVEPDNPRALAEGIKRVLMDKELTDRIGEQAFKDVQEYSWEKRARRIMEFIRARKKAQNEFI